MAGKAEEDKPKVMDVSRPGKGKIVINSRPIAAPLVGGVAESGDVKSPEPAGQVPEPAKEPTLSEIAGRLTGSSTNRKIIQPVHDGVTPEEGDESVSVSVKPIDEPLPAEPEAAPESEAPAEPAADEAPTEEPTDETIVEPDTEASEEPEAKTEKPESSDSLPTPKSDGGTLDAPEPDDSGAATVDEMAKAAEQKRLSNQKTKEEEERDKHVEELVNSKQYFVKISRSKHGHSKLPVFVGVGVIALVIVGYLLADMGLFGKFNLPIEFFKDQETVAPSTIQPAADNTDNTTDEQDDNTSEQQPEDNDNTTAIDKAADEERKQEIRNLATKLEAYFAENGKYPLSLADLTPIPTEDEMTDSTGKTYSYELNDNTFVLSVALSDPSDSDAEAGLYKVKSVNQ